MSSPVVGHDVHEAKLDAVRALVGHRQGDGFVLALVDLQFRKSTSNFKAI